MIHYVYKYVYNGEIIYIGKTSQDLANRLCNHGKEYDNIDEIYREEINQSVVFYIEFNSSIICDIAETCLINKYKPKCNKAKLIDGFEDSGISFNEKKYNWRIFRFGDKFLTSYEMTQYRERRKQESLQRDEEQQRILEHKKEIKNLISKYAKHSRPYIISKKKYIELHDMLCKLCDCNHKLNWFLKRIDYKMKFVRIYVDGQEKYELVKA